MDGSIVLTKSANHDFISELPDPVLHLIMGLLNTKQAVQMSVLSRRWEHLWESLPYLNLNFEGFWPFHKELEDDEWIIKKSTASRRFVDSVNAFLLQRKPLNLDVFRLSCVELSPEHVGHERDWVHYAIKHKTRILCLSFIGSLPICVFSSEPIVELDVSTCAVQIWGKICLPKLKKLRFHETALAKNALRNLLSGCSLLDHLCLDKLTFHESEISHDKLSHMAFFICQNMDIETPLLISAPSLISLWYDLRSPRATLNLLSIIFARQVIFMEPPIPSWDEMADFIRGLVKVQILDIQVMGWLQLQDGAVLPELPELKKLEEFTVGAAPCMCCGGQLLFWIAARSPNLKKLKFMQENDCRFEDSTSELNDGLLRGMISRCTSIELIDIKYHTNNERMQEFSHAVCDAVKELNLKGEIYNRSRLVQAIRAVDAVISAAGGIDVLCNEPKFNLQNRAG